MVSRETFKNKNIFIRDVEREDKVSMRKTRPARKEMEIRIKNVENWETHSFTAFDIFSLLPLRVHYSQLNSEFSIE